MEPGGIRAYLNAISRDCQACGNECGRCESCLNCSCHDCVVRRERTTKLQEQTRLDVSKLVVSRLESKAEPSGATSAAAPAITHYIFRYGKKSGRLARYNNSNYTLYCRKVGDTSREHWSQAPMIRLWVGKTYIFEVIDKELPPGCGGLVLTEKPEGGPGSHPLTDTTISTPGNLTVFTVTDKTPDYFHYHDANFGNTGYIIRVDKPNDKYKPKRAKKS